MAEKVDRLGLHCIVEELLAAFANIVIFLVAFSIGLRIVYAIVFSLLAMGNIGPGSRPLLSEQQAIVFSVSVAFVFFGALSALWTRHVLNVGVTSAVTFLLGMIILAQAMYLADRGDPGRMWRYTTPKPSDYIGSAVSAVAATLGWYSLRWFRRPRSAGEKA